MKPVHFRVELWASACLMAVSNVRVLQASQLINLNRYGESATTGRGACCSVEGREIDIHATENINETLWKINHG